ncbi:MAG: biotin transporter BioY [Eubacterium sp.]
MSEENQRKKFKTLDIVYIGLFAALIAVCAWIAIPLTVSITLQTFAICLTAGLLGWKRGTVTVIVYILLGMIGLPVFTGFKSGIVAVTGPTGGYIVGFIFTALIVGLAADKLGKKIWQNIVFMVIGILVCYLFGTIWFTIAYKVTFVSALSTCVFPFLLPDAVKIVLAAVLVNRLKKFVK